MTDSLDEVIESLIAQLKYENTNHYKSKHFYELLKILRETCPHDKGIGTPSYWNDGSEYCRRCGNDKSGYWNDNLN